MSYTTKNKVFAYITRIKQGRTQLLLQKHKKNLRTDLRILSGYVEPDEDRYTAVLREVFEKSGLEFFQEIRYLGEHEFAFHEQKELHQGTFYQMPIDEDIADEFDFTYRDQDNKKVVLKYKWHDITNLPNLIADHDKFIGLIHLDEPSIKYRFG